MLGLWTADPDHPFVRALAEAPWRSAAGVHLAADSSVADVVLVPVVPGLDVARLRADAAGRPLLLVGPPTPEADVYAALTGLLPSTTSTPIHDVRLRRGTVLDPRDEGDLELRASWTLIDKVDDDVEVLATANTAFTDHAVWTWRPATGIGALTLDGSAAWQDPDLVRSIHRWAHHVTGRVERPAARVGFLAYGAIGHEHLSACLAVPGLVPAAVCDRAQHRIDAALATAPDLAATTDGAELLARDDIDVVIVSTPPDTHAAWALRALEAGKHVVLEKPMALTAADGDAVLDAAQAAGRTALVYQNRRWDPDYLTLKRAVGQGRIGEVFHVESFVGGFGHPCNYWHSDAAVSGGAIFDWGSHFLDQLLDLLPGRVVEVTARNHKRRWHDVTNADHSRVTLTFDSGTEATFIHSDLAAVLKPKYYVVGDAGAIVGDWRQERLLSRTGIGTMAEELFAPADAPATMTLVDSRGDRTLLAPVQPRPHTFHRELADLLLAGLPMTVTPEQSRDVVAVMEAAERSAASGGRPVEVAGLRTRAAG
jgi:scyllo-inositol 2-dehydrogenase (NADP+)